MEMNALDSNISVLVADDHALFREGTRRLLESAPDIQVVGEAANGDEAVRLTLDRQPDVVLMDIAMPEVNGVEATRRIKAEYSKCAVLILTAYDDDAYISALLEAGAAGYLLKSVDANELVDAIRAVRAGDAVLHPAIARKVLRRLQPEQESTGDAPWLSLSEREREVLRMAGAGLSNKEVAQRMGLSARTVQVHLGHIFEKLSVGSRTEAVVLGLKRGWLSLDELEVPDDTG